MSVFHLPLWNESTSNGCDKNQFRKAVANASKSMSFVLILIFIVIFSSNLAVHVLRTWRYKAERVFAVAPKTLGLSAWREALQLR